MKRTWTKKEKRTLKQLLLAGGIFLPTLLVQILLSRGGPLGWPALQAQLQVGLLPVAFLLAYLIVGQSVIRRAADNIRSGQVFDEHFLMTVATLGAFLIGEYAEGVAVMLFYQVGELFQSRALSRSRKSIADLMDIRPDYANVEREGAWTQVEPEAVRPGERILVKPGERIPLDGLVIEGRSALDTSALTGESVPRDVSVGDSVVNGCINISGLLTLEVSRAYGESTVSKILELVEHASDKKSRSEQFITRFARYYTPFVVFSALALALLPPLLFKESFLVWVHRALTFLVISCPCALIISVPLSFFGGIGAASKAGILVKGSNYLEQLAQLKTLALDKTGTLTQGNFAVSQVVAVEGSREELLELAAHAEAHSTHPIASSIRKAFGGEIDPDRVAEVEELGGHGLKARVDGKVVLAGNAGLMDLEGIAYQAVPGGQTVVYLAREGRYAGYIVLADQIKEDSYRAVKALRTAGVSQLVMLTGDGQSVAEEVAAALKLDGVYPELLPADKVEQLERLMAQKGREGKVAFVGDGINDAPVLARSDLGIAMGALGSDAAVEAADVVIMTDRLSAIATAMQIAKKTLRISRQNIAFALLVKGAVLVLGALGYADMWAAVFADVGVTVLAILNAMRALGVKRLPA